MKIVRISIIIILASFVPFFLAVNAVAKTAAEVFEKASQSVVVVKIQDEKGKDIALGSGVVLPGGDVVTNCHVIEKAIGITVYQGKKGYHAVPRYIDYDRDVCSLSVPDMKAPSVSMGSTNTLKVGSRVYAIGTPKGLTLTLSEGIISSLASGRRWAVSPDNRSNISRIEWRWIIRRRRQAHWFDYLLSGRWPAT